MPECYGLWSEAYALFRRWQRGGAWARILSALQAIADAADHITWNVSVDSSTARAHRPAAGARKRGICRPNRLAKYGMGRPITGWAVPVAGKLHLGCE